MIRNRGRRGGEGRKSGRRTEREKLNDRNREKMNERRGAGGNAARGDKGRAGGRKWRMGGRGRGKKREEK